MIPFNIQHVAKGLVYWDLYLISTLLVTVATFLLTNVEHFLPPISYVRAVLW